MDLNLDLADALDTYTTAADTARLCQRPIDWCHRQVRRAGVVEYALFRGERQFDRRAVLTLVLLARLQDRFGQSSAVPYDMVRAAGPAVDAMLARPRAGTLLAMGSEAGLNVVVGVPSLHELLAGVA